MSQAGRRHLAGCGWFWTWAAVGAGAALSVVSFIGTLTALPVVLAALLMLRQPTIRRSAFGVLSGAGLLLLYIAWLHRDGEYLNPIPWLVIGFVLLVAGIAGHALREQRAESL